MKIFHFKQFYKHYVFNENGEGGKKKLIRTTILYFLMLMCVVVGVVSLFQKNFAIGIASIDIGFLVKSLQNTDDWSGKSQKKRRDKCMVGVVLGVHRLF